MAKKKISTKKADSKFDPGLILFLNLFLAGIKESFSQIDY